MTEKDRVRGGPDKTWPLFRWLLLLEMCALFVGGPLLIMGLVRWLIPVILLGGLALMLILLGDSGFERRRLWNIGGVRPHLGRIILGPAIFGILSVVVLYWVDPKALFAFPRSRPGLWIMVMILYPLLAVYPQEVIYRAFFFRRYRPLFGSDQLLVHASAILFSFGHIMFKHWITFVLTLLGGYLFSYTYKKSRSLPAAALEHALYGDIIFTVGLGQYFYTGAQRLQ